MPLIKTNTVHEVNIQYIVIIFWPIDQSTLYNLIRAFKALKVAKKESLNTEMKEAPLTL